MKLTWSAYALADRALIFDYIEAESRVRQSSRTSASRPPSAGSGDFPESGRPGRIKGTREIVISGTPYVAAHVVLHDRVRILRVLLGAQRWPDASPEA